MKNLSNMKFAFVLLLLIAGRDASHAQVSGTRRIPSVPAVPVAKTYVAPPDLVASSVRFEGSNLSVPTARIVVTVKNLGNRDFKGETAEQRVQVWLRVWKPSAPQATDATEPKVTSFVWGGTKQMTGVSAYGNHVVFEVPTPPGGWDWSCFPKAKAEKSGYGQLKVTTPMFCDAKNASDPLRLRIAVRVDPANNIKESNESNNDTIMLTSYQLSQWD